MNKYETIFITGDTITKEQRNTVIDKVIDYINENGKVKSHEDLGLKRLAYTIKKFEKGYYYLIEFECVPEAIHDLELIYRHTEDILKFIIVKKD